MKTVAFVPIKLNNQRTPGKNIKKFDDGSSLITVFLRNLIKVSEAGYPPVVKMGTDGLKITKTSFRKTLKYLLTEKKIA